MADLNADKWKPLTKVSFVDGNGVGWVKTTKVLEVTGVGVYVNVSTGLLPAEAPSDLAEAISWSPGVKYVTVNDIPDLVAI
jgi:hypothetical protein